MDFDTRVKISLHSSPIMQVTPAFMMLAQLLPMLCLNPHLDHTPLFPHTCTTQLCTSKRWHGHIGTILGLRQYILDFFLTGKSKMIPKKERLLNIDTECEPCDMTTTVTTVSYTKKHYRCLGENAQVAFVRKKSNKNQKTYSSHVIFCPMWRLIRWPFDKVTFCLSQTFWPRDNLSRRGCAPGDFLFRWLFVMWRLVGVPSIQYCALLYITNNYYLTLIHECSYLVTDHLVFVYSMHTSKLSLTSCFSCTAFMSLSCHWPSVSRGQHAYS